MTIFKRLLLLVPLLLLLVTFSSAFGCYPVSRLDVGIVRRADEFLGRRQLPGGANWLDAEPSCDKYVVTARNAGSEPTSGPVTLTDTLPEGVTVRQVEFFSGSTSSKEGSTPRKIARLRRGMWCGVRSRAWWTRMKCCGCFVYVGVNEPEAPGVVTNRASVSGGGAPTVSTEASNRISPAAAPFGVIALRLLQRWAERLAGNAGRRSPV